MMKIIIISVVFAAVNCGIIPDHGHGGLILGPVPAPVVHAAPALAIKAHGATSYANSNSISLNPHPVAVAPAPPAVVHAVHAAPVAPVLYGHGPLYGHH